MNTFLLAFVLFAAGGHPVTDSYTPRQVFDRSRSRAIEIDSLLSTRDIRFIQDISFESRSGDRDTLVFAITVRHGKFERHLISGTVPNGDRFNGGYDAFDKMFFLSEYFARGNKILSSCELEEPSCGGCYGLNFSFAGSAEPDDPLSKVSASVDAYTFTPVRIEERLDGLPLGVEFRDRIDVSHDQKTGMYFPDNIEMRVYARFLFLKGEIAVVTIKNSGLEII